MESTNAKKGGSAEFTVSYGERTFFFEEDDKDDNAFTGEDVQGFYGDWSGWVGLGDAIDYSELALDGAARVSFDVNSDEAVKFTVWQLNEKTNKLKSVQATTLKYNKNEENYLATTKELLLDIGTYYISVEHPNAKKGGNADFTVAYGENTHFFEADDKDDNVFTGGDVMSFGGEWLDWVGLGDSMDYCRMDLSEVPARVSFDVTASDAGKFTVWQLNEKTNKLKSVQATTLKLDKTSGDYVAATKSIMLAKGVYYVSMESTNAKKGGSADFTVSYGDDVRYFDDGDNTNDTWKAATENGVWSIGDEVSGWVGFGDAADFYAFEVDEAGKLSLTFDDDTEAALKARQIKLSCLDSKGKNVSLAALKNGNVDSSKALVAGTYYLGVACANTQKFDTNYNVSLGMLLA